MDAPVRPAPAIGTSELAVARLAGTAMQSSAEFRSLRLSRSRRQPKQNPHVISVGEGGERYLQPLPHKHHKHSQHNQHHRNAKHLQTGGFGFYSV
jgi:hypothetical protein